MDRSTKISELFSQAMAEMINKNYTASVSLLTELLAQDPHHALALIARGSVFMQQENLRNAIADFDNAVQLNPDYPRAYHLRGLARFQQGDDQGAMHDFDRAIVLDQEYGAAYYSRANLHSKAGNEEAAAEDAAQATHLGTRNLDSYGAENNIIRSMHMAVEDAMETELER